MLSYLSQVLFFQNPETEKNVETDNGNFESEPLPETGEVQTICQIDDEITSYQAVKRGQIDRMLRQVYRTRAALVQVYIIRHLKFSKV